MNGTEEKEVRGRLPATIGLARFTATPKQRERIRFVDATAWSELRPAEIRKQRERIRFVDATPDTHLARVIARETTRVHPLRRCNRNWHGGGPLDQSFNASAAA